MAFGRFFETACPCVLPSDFPQQVKDHMDDDDLSRWWVVSGTWNHIQKFCFGITTKYFCTQTLTCRTVLYSVVCQFGERQPQTELITTWFSSLWEDFFPISVRSKLVAVWRGQPRESESNWPSGILLCTLEKWGDRDLLFCKSGNKIWVNGILLCPAWHD